MEKKVRFLMVLLCLFLFPMKAFALEGAIEETNIEINNVVVEETNNIENLNDEDLIEIENPSEVLLDEESNKEVGDTLEPTEESAEEETVEINNTTRNVENLESGNDETPTENLELATTELTEFSLTGVTTELVVGPSFSFTGISGDSENYTVVREEWTLHDNYGNLLIASSDPLYNAELQANDLFISSVEEGIYYGYRVVLKFAENKTPAVLMDASINGTIYDAYCYEYDEETNTAIMLVSLYKQAINTNSEYIESIDLFNVITDAIAGKAPTYGASTTTEHFSLTGEKWQYFTVEELPNGYYDYYSFANASNPILIDSEFETEFKTFSTDYYYDYMVVVDSEPGYRLKFESDEDTNYKVFVDGEEVYSEVYGEVLEDGGMRYYIFLAFSVTPTVEETEESPVYEEPVATETAYYGEEETATLLIATPEEEQDNKLEVRKDKDNKKATEKKTEKSKSNVGLIVFLVILIIIAIAIPLTVYKKKQ